MAKAIDPKLAKVIALWRPTEHAGEKAAAQARAEAMAAAAGMTLDIPANRFSLGVEPVAGMLGADVAKATGGRPRASQAA